MAGKAKKNPPVILTIDDAKAVRSLVAKALAPFDCAATEASNGYNGFFAIERAYPDLVLCDVMMPIMGGIETLERLKTTPQLKKIPVIMLPSPSDRQFREEIQRLGADSVLVKPFTEAAVLAKIREFVTLNPRNSP